MRLHIAALAASFGFVSNVSVASDFNADFSISNGNPNGAWSYGWFTTNFSVFTPYTGSAVIGGNPTWYGWGGDYTPGIWKNMQGSTYYGVPANWISLHPGNGSEPCAARWTAQRFLSATVHVVGEFLAGDIGTMQVAVRHNGKSLWTSADAGAFDLLVDVQPGDVIDFVVFGGYFYGNTPLTVEIQPDESPVCPADLDNDGVVGPMDLALVLGDWGTNGEGDVDGSGNTDATDLGLVLGAWGPC